MLLVMSSRWKATKSAVFRMSLFHGSGGKGREAGQNARRGRAHHQRHKRPHSRALFVALVRKTRKVYVHFSALTGRTRDEIRKTSQWEGVSCRGLTHMARAGASFARPTMVLFFFSLTFCRCSALLDFELPEAKMDIRFKSSDFVDGVDKGFEAIQLATASLEASSTTIVEGIQKAVRTMLKGGEDSGTTLIQKVSSDVRSLLLVIDQVAAKQSGALLQESKMYRDLWLGFQRDLEKLKAEGGLNVLKFSQQIDTFFTSFADFMQSFGQESQSFRQQLLEAQASVREAVDAGRKYIAFVGMTVVEVIVLIAIVLSTAFGSLRKGKFPALSFVLVIVAVSSHLFLVEGFHSFLNGAEPLLVICVVAAVALLFKLRKLTYLMVVAFFILLCGVAIYNIREIDTVSPVGVGIQKRLLRVECPRELHDKLYSSFTLLRWIDAKGQLELDEKAAERISQLEGDIFVAASAGIQRSFKSTWGTTIARSHMAVSNPCRDHIHFDSSPQDTSFTRDVRALIVPLSNGGYLLLLDTEGLDCPDRQKEAQLMFAFAALSADVFTFHFFQSYTAGAQRAVQNLELVANFTQTFMGQQLLPANFNMIYSNPISKSVGDSSKSFENENVLNNIMHPGVPVYSILKSLFKQVRLFIPATPRDTELRFFNSLDVSAGLLNRGAFNVPGLNGFDSKSDSNIFSLLAIFQRITHRGGLRSGRRPGGVKIRGSTLVYLWEQIVARLNDPSLAASNFTEHDLYSHFCSLKAKAFQSALKQKAAAFARILPMNCDELELMREAFVDEQLAIHEGQLVKMGFSKSQAKSCFSIVDASSVFHEVVLVLFYSTIIDQISLLGLHMLPKDEREQVERGRVERVSRILRRSFDDSRSDVRQRMRRRRSAGQQMPAASSRPRRTVSHSGLSVAYNHLEHVLKGRQRRQAVSQGSSEVIIY